MGGGRLDQRAERRALSRRPSAPWVGDPAPADRAGGVRGCSPRLRRARLPHSHGGGRYSGAHPDAGGQHLRAPARPGLHVRRRVGDAAGHGPGGAARHLHSGAHQLDRPDALPDLHAGAKARGRAQVGGHRAGGLQAGRAGGLGGNALGAGGQASREGGGAREVAAGRACRQHSWSAAAGLLCHGAGLPVACPSQQLATADHAHPRLVQYAGSGWPG